MKTPTQKKLSATAAQRLSEGLDAARKQLVQVEKDIVVEARKQRRSLEKAIADGRRRLAKLEAVPTTELKQLEKRLTTTAADLQQRVREMPREVLGALGVATSNDVAKLSKTLTRLTKRVDELAKARPPSA